MRLSIGASAIHYDGNTQKYERSLIILEAVGNAHIPISHAHIQYGRSLTYYWYISQNFLHSKDSNKSQTRIATMSATDFISLRLQKYYLYGNPARLYGNYSENECRLDNMVMSTIVLSAKKCFGIFSKQDKVPIFIAEMSCGGADYPVMTVQVTAETMIIGLLLRLCYIHSHR